MGALDFFDVVSPGMDGVRVLDRVVALSVAPPVLTATSRGAEMADEPADVVHGDERFVLSVGELAAGARGADGADDESDDELVGSARAIP